MTLSEYLRNKGISAAEFGRLVQSSRQNVSRWALGQAMPRPEDIRRIASATGGKVTANDFFGVAPRKSKPQVEGASL